MPLNRRPLPLTDAFTSVSYTHLSARELENTVVKPLRQIVHGGVKLLVHFYEGKVGIRTEVEAQADDACTIARLAIHVDVYKRQVMRSANGRQPLD